MVISAIFNSLGQAEQPITITTKYMGLLPFLTGLLWHWRISADSTPNISTGRESPMEGPHNCRVFCLGTQVQFSLEGQSWAKPAGSYIHLSLPYSPSHCDLLVLEVLDTSQTSKRPIDHDSQPSAQRFTLFHTVCNGVYFVLAMFAELCQSIVYLWDVSTMLLPSWIIPVSTFQR